MSTYRRTGDEGLWSVWIEDGLAPLTLGAVALIAAGLVAWFLATTGQLLPHDVAWLTISADELRAIADGRVIDFMDHDRAAFGGTLIAIGLLYLWLIRFPLVEGQRWAWRTLAVSAAIGFASFLTYLGTGYLDTWHGAGTLALLPMFGLGLWYARGRATVHAPSPWPRDRRTTVGRGLLLLTGFGMVVGGLFIATIGALVVFVPQDLEFLGMDRLALEAVDPHLVPLIAHDRAGFGGGLATTGVVVLAVVRFGRPSRALWQSLLLAGTAGFGAAIGVHELIGYADLTHVGPAVIAASLYAAGMVLVRPAMMQREVIGSR
jgi:hypothetical protein